MRASKNSMIGYSLFTVGFLICMFISKNELLSNIIISCLTGCIVGFINAYILYVDEFKSQLKNYLIDIINLISSIERVKKRKIEYTFINFDKNYNDIKYIYENLHKLLAWLDDVVVIDFKIKQLLKLQKEELYKLHKIISENCYYIYSVEDVETQKILLLDVIEKIQKYNCKFINHLIVKCAREHNCLKCIVENFKNEEHEYLSVNILKGIINEKNKGIIMNARRLENQK